MLTEEAKQRWESAAERVKANWLADRLPIFAAAFAYRTQGLHPIPIHPDRKVPLVEWKPYQAMQPTIGDLVSWWTEYPKARVGLVAGKVPGIVVVDVDMRNGGDADSLDVPAGAFKVKTPSGGLHIYLKHPGQPCRNRAGVFRGVDIRGDGGYVVASPSPGYVSEGKLIVSRLPVAPAWVSNGQGVDGGRRNPPGWFAERFKQATLKGERNDTAARLAGYLVHKNLPSEEVQAILGEWAARCMPPFPPEELAQVVQSVSAREGEKRKEEAPALRLWAPSALEAREIRFTVDALVPSATLTLLYGKDKVGKTLLVLDMIKAIRTASPFLGRFATVEGGVIALLLDDPPGLVRERIVDNLHLSDEGLFIATHLDADTDNPMRLLDALAGEAETRKPALIVLDALYVLLEGAEQLHLAGGMRPLMRYLDRIAEESGAAVVLIHHPRKSDEEAAGSFVIRASAKSILRLSKPREDRDDDGDSSDTTRRVLRVEGKYLPEAKYALDFTGPGQWTLLGDAAQVRADELGALLLATISREPGLTGDELADRIGKRKGDVAKGLAKLAQEGKAQSRKLLTRGRGRPKVTWLLPGNFGISPPPYTSGGKSKNPPGDGRDRGDGFFEREAVQ